MHNISKVTLPFTPVRRLFHGAFDRKPAPLALGKRDRISDCENSVPDVPVSRRSLPIPISCTTSTHPDSPPNAYCIALLNDVPADDAVVVTALTAIPFCCHADLLTMPRKQLIGVACALNAHLPVALHIDLNPVRPDGYLRSAIELVVGLRPPAPKPPTRARSLNAGPQESPLAQRMRGRTLLSVDEDFDGELEGGEDRTPLTKRRKLVSSPVTRPLVLAEQPAASSTLPPRARSLDIEPGERSFHVDPAFITTTRPRRRYKPRVIGKMSTPKKVATRLLQTRGKADESELTFGLDGLSIAAQSMAESEARL